MNDFKEISVRDINFNVFNKLNDWMLISAGFKDKFNTMTASWGGFGIIWGKNVSFVTIRNSRYTKEFIDKSDNFSLCFFDKKYKKDLAYLGSVSGRDVDKVSNTHLNVMRLNDVPVFCEADLIIICKKIYNSVMDKENILDDDIVSNIYKDDDCHTVYIGEIEKIFVRC